METWVQWIRDESNRLIAAIDEEILRCQDPDDPFDGTASGIFPPLQGVIQETHQIKTDESKSRSPQVAGTVQEKLVDIQTPVQRQVEPSRQDQRLLLTEEPQPQQSRTQASDSSQSRGEDGEKQGSGTLQNGQPSATTSTQRRIEESQQEILFESEQQADDPFRTLRSFHEKQREERQGENQPRTSTSSHSTLEGAAGGTVLQHPKPQRQTHKNQNQGKFQQKITQQQGNNQPSQNNFYQGPHNTTTYMELPSAIQNKICGRCGLMGHIKRYCKEEVYCKYCKMGTHSTNACRTYPATSSRKNTPEKRTQEDIDQEVNRRVQKDLLRILTSLATNRQIDVGLKQTEVPNQALSGNNPYRHIPERTKQIQSLIGEIGEFQRPADVAEHEQNIGNSEQGQIANSQQPIPNSQEPILNQQWDE